MATPASERAVVTASPRRDRSRYLHMVLLGIPVLFMLVMYVYPVTRLLLKSVTDPTPGLDNFIELATSPVYLRILWLTIRISLEVVIGALLLGYPVAYVLSNTSPRASRLLSLLVLLPFWTSVLVRSFSWMVILGDTGVLNTWLKPFIGGTPLKLLFNEFSVVVGMVHVLLPFMILTVKGTMDQIDTSLVRAATTLGATPARAFLHVYLPLTIPGVASGCMLVFMMSLGFYITPALLGGPRQTMLSSLVERLVGDTFQWGMAAALAVVLLLISGLLYSLLRRFIRIEGLFGG